MIIYDIVFGTDTGQVLCPFHDDTIMSAGIGPNGEFNCFTCGAKAHDEVGFIAKYFGVGLERATKIRNALEKSQTFKYTQGSLVDYQLDYLHKIGLTDDVINKYFFCSSTGKLMYRHTWNGIAISNTWFNSPMLPNHNASAPKYKYDSTMVGGMVTPYDDTAYSSLLICEGEKDMLTAKSMGFKNAVAKVGGAKTYIMGGLNFMNKNIVIVYDCDDAGREGAIQDALVLSERFSCKVKVVDLGLADKEDLNDYFIKYGHTAQDFQTLVANTPVFVPTVQIKTSRLEKFVEGLSLEEAKDLLAIIRVKHGI